MTPNRVPVHTYTKLLHINLCQFISVKNGNSAIAFSEANLINTLQL